MLASALLFPLLFLPVSLQGERDRVLAVLDAAAGSAAPSVPELERELTRPGPSTMAALLEVLASGEAAGRALSALEEAALQSALVSFGAPPLRGLAEQRLAAKASPEEDCALLVAFGELGENQDLGLVRRLAEAAGPAASRSGSVEGALASLLRRDPRGLEAVRRWILQAPDELGAALVRGAGRSECPLAMTLLAGLLGQRTELDALLLPEIGRLAGDAALPIDEGVLAQLEPFLEGEDPRLLREAALALGQAEATPVVPRLIELLEHHDRGVSSAAQRALEEITGLRLRDGERWKAWLLTEARWFEAEGPRLLGELESRAPEIAVRALGEMSCHRMHRQELALAAAPVLAHPSPLVRKLACTALAHLGSRAALPVLRAALEDGDETVSRAARQALAALGVAPSDAPEVPLHPPGMPPARTGSRGPARRSKNR